MDGGSVGKRRWAWLPEGAEEWSATWDERPTPSARAAWGVVLTGGAAWWAGLPWTTAAWAGGLVLGLSASAWPLRRRSEPAADRTVWLVLSDVEAPVLVHAESEPPPSPWPATLTAPGAPVEVLDRPRSPAAVRAAAALVSACLPDEQESTDPSGVLGLALSDPFDDEDLPSLSRSSSSLPRCVVLVGQRGAFALELDPNPWHEDEHRTRTRQRRTELLEQISGAPPSRSPGLVVPAVVAITAADVRAFAAAGLAPAYRLEAAFAGVAVEADPGLDLGTLRAWPSRVDTLPPDSDANVHALLLEDLAAQARRDEQWEAEHGVGESLVEPWRQWWLARLGISTSRGPARDPQVGLSTTGRAALLLAVTATDLSPAPLRPSAEVLGVPPEPAGRWLPWPRGARSMRVADRVLLGAVLAVPAVIALHGWLRR